MCVKESEIICSVHVLAHIYRCVFNGLCMRVLCGLRHLDSIGKRRDCLCAFDKRPFRMDGKTECH